MTFRSLKYSVGTTMLAGLLATAAFSQTPASDPYGPAGPPPGMQQGQTQQPYNQGQYGQQGYSQDPNQQQGPTPQQQAAATITNHMARDKVLHLIFWAHLFVRSDRS